MAQLIRFGIIGLMTTFVHLSIFVAAIEYAELSGSISNLIAFSAAVIVSFFGHYFYSFKDQLGDTNDARGLIHMPAFLKFCLVSTGGFLLNSLIAWSIVDSLNMDYWIAVIMMMTVTPITIFLLSKYWVFRQTAVAETQR